MHTLATPLYTVWYDHQTILAVETPRDSWVDRDHLLDTAAIRESSTHLWEVVDSWRSQHLLLAFLVDLQDQYPHVPTAPLEDLLVELGYL